MANGQIWRLLLERGMAPGLARPLSPRSFQERVGRQRGLLPPLGRQAGSSVELLEGRARRTGLMERRQQSQAQPGVARPPRAPKAPVSPMKRAPGSRALVQRGVKKQRGEL